MLTEGGCRPGLQRLLDLIYDIYLALRKLKQRSLLVSTRGSQSSYMPVPECTLRAVIGYLGQVWEGKDKPVARVSAIFLSPSNETRLRSRLLTTS